MFCSNCGTKVTDGAKFCTNCGQKLTSVQVKEEKSRGGMTLTIVRAKQWYAVNPPIQIIVDGQQNYSVENGMYIDIPILAGRHHILFSCAMRKKAIDVNITQNTALYVKFSRMTGGIQVENYMVL